MTLTVRKAVRGDLPALLAIYENAAVLCRPTATRPSGRPATPVPHA